MNPERPVAVHSPRHSATQIAQQPRRDSISIDLLGDLVVLEIG